MTWLQLTSDSGETVLLNADNAIQIKPHTNGSQLMFSAVIPSKEGKMHAKTVTVTQSIEQIGKALKASSAK
ncbi:hypothetical protein MUO32_29170 [Shinella sp. CPCC 101442]|uniref:hypothetical protein n=1 Tax=Shinella sp. CPCC 101442 TaxID=2932265 RepID=UPI00215287D0|nr:hypothetical protein [Shinella sp. CPCC 101442]MCR6503088.1 hypothetical protein [Shinella sp. CPCC 101442]